MNEVDKAPELFCKLQVFEEGLEVGGIRGAHQALLQGHCEPALLTVHLQRCIQPVSKRPFSCLDVP